MKTAKPTKANDVKNLNPAIEAKQMRSSDRCRVSDSKDDHHIIIDEKSDNRRLIECPCAAALALYTGLARQTA